VTGAIHPIPDGSTAACAADLLDAYTYLNTLPYDIELLYPAQFGRSLSLTPHTYLLNGATTFTDTLYLNARGNANAVFVIQINGALTTSTYSKVILTNGTLESNVFWKIEGAVSISDNSIFKGTIICNNGAIDLNTGVTLKGRALTTTGAISTTAISAVMPPDCSTVGITSIENSTEIFTIYPNPFRTSASIRQKNASISNASELKLYNILGDEIMTVSITKEFTALNTNALPPGMYSTRYSETTESYNPAS